MNKVNFDELLSEFNYTIDGLENFEEFVDKLEETEGNLNKNIIETHIKILESRRDSMNRIIEQLKEELK